MATHILKQTRAVLDITFAAGDSSTPVEVAVTDDAGAAVQDGTATPDNNVPPIVGRYTFALNPQTELGVLRVEWSGTWDGVAQTVATYAEIVGSRLFTVAELRAHDEAIADPDAFPDWKIAVARDRVEDFFRDAASVSFTKRRRRFVTRIRGGERLLVPDRTVSRVVAVEVDGTALTAGEIADLDVGTAGEIIRGGSWGSSWLSTPIVVTYEHGYDDPPAQIKYAAMILARREVVTIDVDDRAVSLSNDLGTVRLSVPTPGGMFRTGIPIVDQALEQYSWTELFV